MTFHVKVNRYEERGSGRERASVRVTGTSLPGVYTSLSPPSSRNHMQEMIDNDLVPFLESLTGLRS